MIKMIPAIGIRKKMGVTSHAAASKLSANRSIRPCAKRIMWSLLNIHDETAIAIAEPVIQ
jgi:hypothetical protein